MSRISNHKIYIFNFCIKIKLKKQKNKLIKIQI